MLEEFGRACYSMVDKHIDDGTLQVRSRTLAESSSANGHAQRDKVADKLAVVLVAVRFHQAGDARSEKKHVAGPMSSSGQGQSLLVMAEWRYTGITISHRGNASNDTTQRTDSKLCWL